MSEKTTFTKGDLSITTTDPAEKVRLRSQGFAAADTAATPAKATPAKATPKRADAPATDQKN